MNIRKQIKDLLDVAVETSVKVAVANYPKALDTDSTNIRRSNEEVKVVKLAITELKQINDLYTTSYDQLRTRIITVVAAGFALLGYLYRDPGQWFLPTNVYGIILYAVAWICLLVAFTALFIGLHPATWYYPMELKDLKKLQYAEESKFLEEIRSEYLETITCNSKPYERKQLLYRIGLDTLIIGGIMLMVISQLVHKGVL